MGLAPGAAPESEKMKGLDARPHVSCLSVLPITPKNGTPVDRWRWPFHPGKVAQLPHTHSLDAKGCGTGMGGGRES